MSNTVAATIITPTVSGSSVIVRDNMGDLWVQIPEAVAAAAGLDERSAVLVAVESGGLVVRKVGETADAEAVLADAMAYMDRHAETFERLKDA